MKNLIVLTFLSLLFFSAQGQTAEEYYNRALEKSKQGDQRGAIADFSKAIELNITDALVYTNRGAAKKSLEDYRGAIADYNKAIELNPKDMIAYFLRGIARYNLGDIDGACLDWSKAGELGDGGAYDMIKEYCN